MSDTPVLSLPEIAEGVASQAVLHNEALRALEARLVRALSRTTTAPPGSPAEGDSYIVATGATGDWSGLDDQVASYIGGAWSYYTPVEGVRLWVNDDDEEVVYDGAAWTASGGGAGGDVVGPGSSTDGHLVQFDGATGKLLKDGIALDTDGTLAANSDGAVASQKAVKTYVTASLGTPGHAIEDEGPPLTQRGTVNFTGAGVAVTDAGGKTVVTIAGGGSGDVVGPASSTDGHFAQFNGATGKLLKDTLALDTDTTLAADSDTRVPSQKAVKAYVTASAGSGGTSITGTTGATGGNATVTGGTSTTSANAGGSAVIVGGTPGATGTGGAVSITGGTPVAGDGGAISITGSAGVGSTKNGGAVTITAGASGAAGFPNGAIVTITGGQVVVGTNTGGAVNITGGTGGPSSGDGGAITLKGGSGASSGGTGGPATLQGGGAATGGAASVLGGTPVAGTGGAVNITAAAGVGTNRAGGNVTIRPGAATGSGNPGNIQLDGGRGAALATTAIGGFVTIPTCAGTPTGTPVNVPTGSVAMVFDTTAAKLWVYTGSWKGVVVA